MARMQALTSGDCFELLATATVGRIALTQDALPVILPVNYRLDGHRVVVRTNGGAILHSARAGGTVVAFEVDDLDETASAGWSVLVTGTLREVTSTSAVLRAEQLPLYAWPGDERHHFVQITPDIISGRYIPPLRAAVG